MVPRPPIAVIVSALIAASSTAGLSLANEPDRSPLPGTGPLGWTDDISSRLVAGVDKFLLGELDRSIADRAKYWKRDFSSAEKYNASIDANRKRLAHIIGARDERVPFDGLELLGTTAQPPLVGQGKQYKVFAVRWPAFGDVHAEGLLLVPDSKPVADVLAIPHADHTPEMIAGLTEGVPAESQYARRLAESGCRVLVPVLVSRTVERNRRVVLSNREYVYRSAFELGRHLIGYELQKVLSGVDWFARQAGKDDPRIGLIGWGEGGLLALYAGALDARIDAVCVSGYFDCRQNLWQEPIDRNVFGLLEPFGDAELAGMIAPRTLIIEAAKGPQLVLPPGTAGGPGRLVSPKLENVRKEVARANDLIKGFNPPVEIPLIVSREGNGPFGSQPALQSLLGSLAPGARLAASGPAPGHLRKTFDPHARQRRQIYELDRHNQWLLGESQYVRKQFMLKLDSSSLEKFNNSAQWYRRYFADEVIGRFACEPLPPNVRSRKSYDEPKYVGYEVVMDVFPEVIAYGILLLPKGIKPGEKRPVVVCQHGLEGRPQDTLAGGNSAYSGFASRLAERGFVTFSPQNLYIFKDRFRTLQRKANPIKKTLFSIIVPQHRQITDWLGTLPQVDSKRIAFYGLSYGGKSAMRIPPLVDNYCLSICSGDFNEWVWKNASTSARRYSYMWTGEYEIFEFDLGNTFNYAEMAALIAPRPFMVERGHFDGVAPDEAVGYEFAKVRHLYQARLKIGDRCRIEWFPGPHKINAVGTFDFLHEHLDWPKPGAKPADWSRRASDTGGKSRLQLRPRLPGPFRERL